MKQYIIPNLILKEKFKDHEKFKSETLNLIKNANDNRWNNKNDYYNDNMLKTHWPDASFWERPWVKLIVKSLYERLDHCANHMGFQSVELHNMWYQEYGYNDVHKFAYTWRKLYRNILS